MSSTDSPRKAGRGVKLTGLADVERELRTVYRKRRKGELSREDSWHAVNILRSLAQVKLQRKTMELEAKGAGLSMEEIGDV